MTLLHRGIATCGNALRLFKWRLLGLHAGKYVCIAAGVELQNCARITLAEHVTIYKNVTVYISPQGSLQIQAHSHMAPFAYCLIANNRLTIGQNVAIGPFCSFFCHSNSYIDGQLFTNSYIDGDISIGNNVFIGAQCVILAKSIIHDNVQVAANSVVSGELPSGYLYGGSPAVAIKPLSSTTDTIVEPHEI